MLRFKNLFENFYIKLMCICAGIELTILYFIKYMKE